MSADMKAWALDRLEQWTKDYERGQFEAALYELTEATREFADCKHHATHADDCQDCDAYLNGKQWQPSIFALINEVEGRFEAVAS